MYIEIDQFNNKINQSKDKLQSEEEPTKNEETLRIDDETSEKESTDIERKHKRLRQSDFIRKGWHFRDMDHGNELNRTIATAHITISGPETKTLVELTAKVFIK